MLKKIIKSSLVAVATIGLSFSLTHGASAEENIAGKCSITIDKTKHTMEHRAIATGACAKRVTGFYGAGHYTVFGGHDADVVDGEKYLVSIPPAFGYYEVTVHTVGSVSSLKAPVVSSVGVSDKTLTGTTEPNVKVTAKAGKTTLGSTTADKNGKYTIKLKKTQKVGTKLTVTVIKGKETKTKTVTVKYKAPKVNAVKPTSTKVTGTTESKAKVNVKVGSKIIGTAVADKNGKYTVKISKQKVGVKLSVLAVKSGISTKTTTMTVK